MRLDPAIAVADDLWAFRCTVTVSLFDPKWVDDLQVENLVRTYGLSAGSFAQACGLADELGGRSVDDEGSPLGGREGWVEEIEVALMDPEEVRAEGLRRSALEAPGVHFASPALYFDDEGRMPEGDPLDSD